MIDTVTLYDPTGGPRTVDLSTDAQDAIAGFQYIVARAFRSDEAQATVAALMDSDDLTEEQAITTLYEAATAVIENGAEDYL